MDFRVHPIGQVAAGTVQVGENDVRLQVTLPWLLHKFGQVIQKTTAGKGQILLGNQATAEGAWRPLSP